MLKKFYTTALTDGKAYDWLDYLSNEIGGRLSGSFEAESAVKYTETELNALGLDKETTLAYIADNKPSYFQFEAWVKQNMKADADIAAHNAAVTGYIHDDDTRAEIFGAAGLSDDTCTARDAVNLNNYDDWTIWYNGVIAG